MNLLDTASLVVTPNGYKASKLYSIVPSDGSGDMTFARTGDTATRVNSSGLIETVLANKPRLDYTSSTCPKLLLEPQRTNLLQRSQEFDNAYYTVNNTSVTANVTTSPDGTTNADLLKEDSTASAIHRIYSTGIGISSSTIYTLTCYAKLASGSRNLRVDMGGGFGDKSAIFNLSLGTIVNTAVATTATITALSNGWYRLSVTATSGAAATNVNAIFWLMNNTSDTYSGDNTSGFYLYGAQLEAGAYATSYIPTTTASVTRNADSCVKTTITSLLGQTEGTIFADINFNKASASFIDFVSMTGTNVVEIQYNNSDGKIYFVYYQAGDLCRIPSTTTIVKGNRYKLAGAYKNNDFIFYINGVQQGTDTSGTITGSLTNFGINGGYSPSQGNYEIVELNSAAHWKTRLQNSELATLTSL